MNFQKDLLGLRSMPAEEITALLDSAADMKKIIRSGVKNSGMLTGKAVATLFYENSTRTRLSFELAAQYLGAHVTGMSSSGSSVAKGENLIDTGKTIDIMGVDAVVIRHQASGAPVLLAQNINAAVINAGDGMHEHPTQALLDLFTMREHLGAIRGLTVAIVGDILHSRVARSNLWGLTTLGATVRFAAPITLLPPAINNLPCEVYSDVRAAVSGADVVMALRIQAERQKSGLFPSLGEYSKFFGINETILKYAKPGALLMHPGPCNRGVELSSAAYDNYPQSVITEQVQNGVAVRMAVLNQKIGKRS